MYFIYIDNVLIMNVGDERETSLFNIPVAFSGFKGLTRGKSLGGINLNKRG